MTTDELLRYADERLSGMGNPPLPPKEMLSAIIAIGKELANAKKTITTLNDQIAEYRAKVEIARNRIDDAEFNTKKALDEMREQKWIAHELGKFISDVANGLYEDREIPAAQRVYDLNKSSLKKRRLNAYNYDSLEEAKAAYMDYCKQEKITYYETNLLGWLFSYAARP